MRFDNDLEAKIKFEKALELYENKRYLDSELLLKNALGLSPNRISILINLSACLLKQSKFTECINHTEKLIEQDPSCIEAFLNLGRAHQGLHIFDLALQSYQRALDINPQYTEAWSNQGVTLNELKRYGEALQSYQRALDINPNTSFGLGGLIHTKLLSGYWVNLEKNIDQLIANFDSNNNLITPFASLSATDSENLHSKIASSWFNKKYAAIIGAQKKLSDKHNKIRVAYFSADFYTHPVGFLISDLIKLHDREKFDIYGFSLKKAPRGDSINIRLKNSFDYFHEVGHLIDDEITKLSSACEIDIAIDLGGYTTNSRTAIFAKRLAPIQVNFLGYAGTMGTTIYNYIIADKVVIPNSRRHNYLEKIAYMPHCFMPHNSMEKISSKKFDRASFNLPNDKFVFCSFNNSYKINPTVAKSWANILKKSDSVLWISKNNLQFAENIYEYFKKCGVAKNRIIFAEKLDSMEEHLRRHELADLFLDTSPYNAHTTAIDALKSGLPILTKIGNSFASSVCASLLKTLGLNEMIVNSIEEYEALALKYVNDSIFRESIKNKLKKEMQINPLFNSEIYARNIENLYIQMYKNKILQLDSIDLMSSASN